MSLVPRANRAQVIGSLGVLLGAVLLAALLGNVQALVQGSGGRAARKRDKVAQVLKQRNAHAGPLCPAGLRLAAAL